MSPLASRLRLAAHADGAFLGDMVVEAGTGVPELIIGVRPIWRAHGIGRALLQRLCEHARAEGFAA